MSLKTQTNDNMVCYNYNYISLQHASPKLSYNMALSSSPCLTTKPSLGSLAFPMVIILYGLQVGCLFDYLTARIPLPLVSLHSISLPPTHLKNTWIVLSFLSSLLLISACVHSHLSLFLPVYWLHTLFDNYCFLACLELVPPMLQDLVLNMWFL